MSDFDYGENMDSIPIHVRHAELTRANGPDRSVCPICRDGLLLTRRDGVTLELLAMDRCTRCAQSFIYDDVEEMRDKLRGV